MAPEAIIPMQMLSNPSILALSEDNSHSMKLGRASDIWSLGCILYQMIYGSPPFAQLTTIQKLTAIPNPKITINYPKNKDFAAIESIQACLKRNPKDRMCIQGANNIGLLNMQYLQIPPHNNSNLPETVMIESATSTSTKPDMEGKETQDLKVVLHKVLQLFVSAAGSTPSIGNNNFYSIHQPSLTNVRNVISAVDDILQHTTDNEEVIRRILNIEFEALSLGDDHSSSSQNTATTTTSASSAHSMSSLNTTSSSNSTGSIIDSVCSVKTDSKDEGIDDTNCSKRNPIQIFSDSVRSSNNNNSNHNHNHYLHKSTIGKINDTAGMFGAVDGVSTKENIIPPAVSTLHGKERKLLWKSSVTTPHSSAIAIDNNLTETNADSTEEVKSFYQKRLVDMRQFLDLDEAFL